jgi:nucleotide-binding universal stress UspA family protein
MKAIMLHIEADAGLDARLQVAVDLTRQCKGRIACVQVAASDARAQQHPCHAGALANSIDMRHDQDRQARHRIEARLQHEAVGWDWRCCATGVADALITQSRLVDLVVISQPTCEHWHEGGRQAVAGDVIVHASVPVLVVPCTASAPVIGGAAMLAWNGSAEAAQAMRLAVPLLRLSTCVHIVEVGDGDTGASAAAAARYLAGHDIACEVHDWPVKGRRTAEALHHAAQELEARYLVMGAYCRQRQRQTLLGDVTRELVESATLPLLLAH